MYFKIDLHIPIPLFTQRFTSVSSASSEHALCGMSNYTLFNDQ